MTISELDELSTSDSSSNYLLCLMEQKRGGSGTDEFVQIGIMVIIIINDNYGFFLCRMTKNE